MPSSESFCACARASDVQTDGEEAREASDTYKDDRLSGLLNVISSQLVSICERMNAMEDHLLALKQKDPITKEQLQAILEKHEMEAKLCDQRCPSISKSSHRAISSAPCTSSSESSSKAMDAIDSLKVEQSVQLSESASREAKNDKFDFVALFYSSLDDLSVAPYRVEGYYYKTGRAQAVAKSTTFQAMTAVVILLSAVYIGVDEDNNTAATLYDAPWFFIVATNFFCVYFLVEWLVRFLAFEQKANCLRDGWFVFDTGLLAFELIESWIIDVVIKLIEIETKQRKLTIPTYALRLVSLLKLVRVARLGRAFPELVMMFKGFFRSLRAIISTLILLVLIMYALAIVIHKCMRDEDEFNSYLRQQIDLDFSSIAACMWTMTMDGALMLDGSLIFSKMLEARDTHVVFAGIMFFAFGLLSSLCILQMVIGVLCDVVSQGCAEQRDALAVDLMKREIVKELKSIGGVDGSVSQDDLMKVMRNPHSVAVMKKLKINQLFLAELQRCMFKGDRDKVSIQSVIDVMLMCRGDNVATVEALASGFCFISDNCRQIRLSMQEQNNYSSI